MSYDELARLGSGRHEIQFNERVKSQDGLGSNLDDANRKRMRLVKFELFCDRMHSCIAGEPFATLVWSFSPELADEIFPLLGKNHIAALSAYAKEIPISISSEQAKPFGFFSSTGHAAQVPLENLIAIKKYFGENT